MSKMGLSTFKTRRWTIVLGLLCVVFAHASVFGAAKRPATGIPEVAPPPMPPIVSLLLEPSSLTLLNSRDSRQILVWGVTQDGVKFDVTEASTLKSESAGVRVEADRYICAVAGGDAKVTVSAAGKTAMLPVKVISADVPKISFARDVEPIMAKVGCNAGTCHGANSGKNGFKLSLRGYDADYDFNALVNDLQGRRFDRVEPQKSLMLLKPAAVVPHEGRKVLDPGTRHYETVLQWIREGVTRDADPHSVRPSSVEVLPKTVDLDLPGRTQRVIVIAHYPDGTSRDVTREAILSSNNPEVAKVAENQVMAIRRGEAAILVRYEGNYGVANLSVMGDRSGFAFKPMPEYNFIDRLINNKLQKQKILPSDDCTDADYVRRVYLDLTGVPPTASVARAFVEDKTPSLNKRTALADKLIGSRDFVAYWSNRWADLLQCNSKALGDKGVWVFREWIRQSVAQNKPYDQFAYELITAQGSSFDNPATSYFRALKDRNDAGALTTNKITEDVSQTFLGVRFNCNKCHDHPFERWTQQQYYQFGAFFARVAFKPGPRLDEEIVYSGFDGAEVMHPKTGVVVPPKVPYGTEPDTMAARFRQEAFAKWLTSRDNPLFAKSYSNRVWSYFFGRGIIDPVDDIRASNPPGNPELLDALTDDFVKSNFDARHLMRMIVTSRAYQASVTPNDWNRDDKINFSHALPRRLTAEQMYDAVASATGTKPRVPGLPEDMRSVYLADGMVADGSDFLKLFGRPKRETACECERSSNLSLAHALNLINGPLISGAVTDAGGMLSKLVSEQPDDRKVIDQIYYAVLNRPPTGAEVAAISLGPPGPQRIEVAQDLTWALLNSPAFLFNR